MSDDIVAYFGDKKRLAQIDAEAVKRYIKYLNTEATTKSGQPLSATTVVRHYQTLRNIINYAIRFGYLKDDPCKNLSEKDKPHLNNKKIDFLTPEQAQKFMKCLNDEPLFWQCFMNILITTGLRRGECVGLQWGDMDSDKLQITVKRNVTMDKEAENKIHIGETKTKEQRVVPISQRLNGMFKRFKAEQEGKWIVEIEELLAVLANDKQGSKVEETAKAFLSTQSDFYRKPYDRRPMDNPRHCIFIGTTNRDEFLTDKTGNRRWYPVRCNSDASYIYSHKDECRSDIRQCWAEMLTAYKNAEAFAQPTARRDLLNEIRAQQAGAECEDYREGVISEYLADKDYTCVLELWYRIS